MLMGDEGKTRKMDQTSLIITDDHAFTRSGMQHRLTQSGRFNVLGQAENAVETLRLARTLKPELALIDYMLPDACGLEVLIELRRWVPECKVVLLTGRDDATIAQPLIDAGADGLLSKASPEDEILAALTKVADGARVFDPVFLVAAPQGDPGPALSARELEVLLRIAKGKSNRAIADELALSPKTIESHRASLMRKLDVNTTATLVLKAARTGLIEF